MGTNTKLIIFDELYIELFLSLDNNSIYNFDEIVVPINNWGLINIVADKCANKYNVRLCSKAEILQILLSGRMQQFLILGYNEEVEKYDLFKTLIQNCENEYYILDCKLNISKYTQVPANIKLFQSNQIYRATLQRFSMSAIVIFIFNTSKHDNSLYTQLLLSDKFKKNGYNVLNLSTVDISECFRITNIEKFISNAISLSDRINELQRSLTSKIIENDINIVIVSIEHLLDVWDNKRTDLNELSYIVMNAFAPDFCVMNLLSNALINNWISYNYMLLNAHAKNTIDCFCIANKYFDEIQSVEYGIDMYIECKDINESQLIKSQKNELCIYDYSDIESIWNCILALLDKSEYIV